MTRIVFLSLCTASILPNVSNLKSINSNPIPPPKQVHNSMQNSQSHLVTQSKQAHNKILNTITVISLIIYFFNNRRKISLSHHQHHHQKVEDRFGKGINSIKKILFNRQTFGQTGQKNNTSIQIEWFPCTFVYCGVVQTFKHLFIFQTSMFVANGMIGGAEKEPP